MPIKIFPFFFLFILIHNRIKPQTITTFAGNGTYGYSGDGGPATSAQLAWAIGIVADNAGNVYIADHDNNVIRKVDNTGIISTFAGTGKLGYSGDGGTATSAKLYHPAALNVDNAGNLYFTDQNADVIRKINSAGIITSLTGNLPIGYSGDGGPVALAQFRSITGITPDNRGNLYIADGSNHAIRKVNASGIITTVAGNGTAGFSGDGGSASSAKLSNPYEVVIDAAGNIYIPDAGNNRIRKINSSGVISTFAGNGIAGYNGDGGPATSASLHIPWFCAIDNAGNLYVSDALNSVVRKITHSGVITTYAGNGLFGNSGDGGPAVSATMADICGIAIDNLNNLYIVNRTPYYTARKVSNCLSATIDHQPSNLSICNAGNAKFSISALNALAFQWQVNAGSGWNNLGDNAIYYGTSSNSLSITGATKTMNNYKYRCSVRDACGNIFSLPDTLTVTSPSTPFLTISTTTDTICAGTTATFYANVRNGGSSPIHLWKINGITTGTNAPIYSDNNLSNGDIVSCILTSNSSCITTNTAQSNAIIVTVNPVVTPSVSITPSANNVCLGTPVTFTTTTVNAGNSPSFQWLKNGVAVGTNLSSYNDNTLTNGDIISCILTSGYACVSSPSAKSNAVVMNISPVVAPAVIVSASKNPVCPNTPVTFTASIRNGGSAPVYQWKKNGVNVGSGSGTYTDNNISNGDVISSVLTSNSNCLAGSSVESNSINMTVSQNPVVSLNHLTTLCEASSRQLNAGSFSTYLWNNGSSGRILSINNIGTYYVTVTDKNGCVGSDTVKITSLLSAPKNFLPFDTSICSYGSLDITSSLEYKTYAWNTSATTPVVTITKAGLYWLEVVDGNNCKGRDTINVSQRDCMKGFYIPTAFTPNRDGKNDFFRPMVFGDIRKYEFMIYNRFGQPVFHTNDITKGWDGRASGTDQDTNTFV